MSTPLSSRAFVMLVAIGAMAGCFSEPTQQESCAALAQSTCDALQRCNLDLFQRTYPDSPTCVNRQQLACSYQFPEGSNTTTQNFIACAKAVPGAACNQLVVNQPSRVSTAHR